MKSYPHRAGRGGTRYENDKFKVSHWLEFESEGTSRPRNRTTTEGLKWTPGTYTCAWRAHRVDIAPVQWQGLGIGMSPHD